ncbi:hypothetical protein LSCM1_01439 [Leishmania martiniquensis]|uniref:SPRY domain-containing protein n=1 Tax=Leishmania martiniquensis TaxID=1580590 RepID=A0A836H6L2_9TRYP|nr:hypothetical protein LSCM1_01439 [Leishmania martiniquensis]
MPTAPPAATSRSTAAPCSLLKGAGNTASASAAPRSPLTPSDVNVAFTATKPPMLEALGDASASSGEAPVAVGRFPSRTAERSAVLSDTERGHLPQPRPEKDSTTHGRTRIVSGEASASADAGRAGSGARSASTFERPQNDLDQGSALRAPAMPAHKATNGAGARPHGSKDGDEGSSGTAAALSRDVGAGAATKPAAARQSAGTASLSTADATDVAGGQTPTKAPEATPPSNVRDEGGASLTPRRRCGAVPPQPSLSPLTTISTGTLSSDNGDVESSPFASEKKGGAAHTAETAGANGRGLSGAQRGVSVPCRAVSATVSATVAAARARLAASSSSSTPRPSTGSFAAGACGDGSADAKSADAAAVRELRELRQALRDKERDVARLERDAEKAKQSAAKAQKKNEELQGRLEHEKSAFAAHKKDTLAQKHELQRELRHAQASLRSAEQVQDKLQRDLDKQREKLATAPSHTASSSATPAMTPRPVAPPSVSPDATLQAKVSSLANEREVMRDRIQGLEEQLSVAAAAVTLAKTAEEQRSTAAAAASEAAETAAALKEEVLNLRRQLASQDAAVCDARGRKGALGKESAPVEARERADGRPARTDGAAATLQTAATSGKGESEGRSMSVLSLRQAVPPEAPSKEAMAHLQEELTAAQKQVGAYKRMLEYAERHAEQQQAELAAAQRRAEALEEEVAKKTASRSSSTSPSTTATTAILRDTIADLRKKLASVTAECGELRRCVQERTEEATTLQSALQEAEDERDAKTRRLRDLQTRAAKAKENAASTLAVEKVELSDALTKAKAELRSVKAELQAALDSARVQQEVVNALRSQVGEEQKRCSDMEEAKQAAQKEAAVAAAAAEASKQEAAGHKRKARQLARKLNEALRELAVLGEEYERVCEERRKMLSRPIAQEKAAGGTGEVLGGRSATRSERSTTTGGTEAVVRAVSPVQAKRTDSVSRNLSDALLSAHRLAAVTRTTSAALALATPDAEGRAREPLELDVLSLYSKVSAIDYFEPSPPSWAERGGAAAVAAAVAGAAAGAVAGAAAAVAADASSANLLLEGTHDRQGDHRKPLRMSLALQQRPTTSSAPGRARSPQAAHALDTRYFDPTVLTCSRSPQRNDGADSIAVHSHVGLPQRRPESQQRGCSLSSQALRRSPRSQSKGSAPSPCRGLSPRSVASSASATALRGYRGDSIASPAEMFSELPAASVYYSTSNTGYRDKGAGQRAAVELRFSSTAGRLLLSKRGRCVQRLVCPTAVRGEANLDVCCTAIGSVSHTIYASHMSAKGYHHLKHTFRFIIRILSDWESCDGGDILMGFADRYVPMETFGAKRNALHYSGCYYLSLRNGRLFCPAQDIVDTRYRGWSAAAAGAAERRRGGVAEPRRDGGVSLSGAHDAEEPTAEVRASSSPEGRRALSRRQRVARAGDEIACTLHIDERAIRYSWNGVDCGVAFTDVSLSPSLYPCVEVNASGGAVELL